VLERATALFPFAVAVVLPPAGALIGLFTLRDDRELGIRLIVVAALAAVVWTLLILS
jgi:hypothetical protein